ncbi:MAG: class I SAM-dependent methyltransferase, partial [Candidatus Omnitrophica bacterium]|nr:class I SAM-dependent methyltransferase [Candidatus Omnitrophota bacterium]
EFYIEVDRFRYRYESYIPPLIDSFVNGGNLVLEIGCGLGSDSRYMAKKGLNVISLDLSFNNVSLTLKGASRLGLNIKGVCADAENLPFKDESFDLVYSFGVLHHTPDTQKAIDEIYRVLKPGGKCAVMLYHRGLAYYYVLTYGFFTAKFLYMNKEELFSKYYDHTPLSKIYSTREAKRFFNKFDNIKIEYTTFGGIRKNRYLKWLWYLMTNFSFLLKLLGSFIIIKAEKTKTTARNPRNLPI